MSVDPRVSRFSDDSEQSSAKEPQQSSLPTQDKQDKQVNKDSSKLRHHIPDVVKLVTHSQPAHSKASDDRDKCAVQAYADYVCSYNDWKTWLAKLNAAEDHLENISLQLEHFARDAIMQARVLGQWRSSRLAWHDLTRLTYIALHKCAFHMTQYHNLLTEVYNERDAEADRLAQELKDANKLIRELSVKLKSTNDSARSLVLEAQTVHSSLQQSFHSPAALTESWDNLDTTSEGRLNRKGSEVFEPCQDLLAMME